jgi:hypothetical protein
LLDLLVAGIAVSPDDLLLAVQSFTFAACQLRVLPRQRIPPGSHCFPSGWPLHPPPAPGW